MPGEISEREPPDPISNSEVKTFSANDSVGSPHVKVGHCQAFMQKETVPCGRFFFCVSGNDLLDRAGRAKECDQIHLRWRNCSSCKNLCWKTITLLLQKLLRIFLAEISINIESSSEAPQNTGSRYSDPTRTRGERYRYEFQRENENFGRWLKRDDIALYRAKDACRNRVVTVSLRDRSGS